LIPMALAITGRIEVRERIQLPIVRRFALSAATCLDPPLVSQY